MKKTTSAVALFFVSLLFTAHTAQTLDTARVVGNIQKKYASVNDLSASFTQETRIRDTDEKIVSSGEVWFKKPAMMKWQYKQPWKDTIVSDGKKVLYYDSQENHITETGIESVWTGGLGSYTLISILEDLDRLFDVRPAGSGTDGQGNILLHLYRREKEHPQRVTIAVNPETCVLLKIIIGDLFGNTTVMELGAQKINSGLSDSLFTLAKPKGARTATFP